MPFKKLNRRATLIILAVAFVPAVIFFFSVESAAPATTAAPITVPATLQAMTPEAPVIEFYPPIIHAAGAGEIMLSTTSYIYPFRDSALPFKVRTPGSEVEIIITEAKVIHHASLFPSSYIIQYKGEIIRGTETSRLEMEETNDWPLAMDAAVVWKY